MQLNFKNRIVGVINITSRGAFIITLTNRSGQVNRAKFTVLDFLKQNIQNIDWFNNNINDIPDEPTAILSRNEKIVGTVTITTGNTPPAPVVGSPVLTKAFVIVHGLVVDIIADTNDGWQNMANHVGNLCAAFVSDGAATGNVGTATPGQQTGSGGGLQTTTPGN